MEINNENDCESCSKIVFYILLLRNQMKIYHWQTKFYGRHKAADNLVDELDDLVDKFVESYSGKYANIKLIDNYNDIKIRNIKDDQMLQYTKSMRQYIQKEASKISNTELLNIIDEIIAVINKTLYLFKLQ